MPRGFIRQFKRCRVESQRRWDAKRDARYAGQHDLPLNPALVGIAPDKLGTVFNRYGPARSWVNHTERVIDAIRSLCLVSTLALH